MTLKYEEFLRRFLQHVLPKGLPRIRYFGWLANRHRRELLPLCRTLLAAATLPPNANLADTAVWRCPACGSYQPDASDKVLAFPVQVIVRISDFQADRDQAKAISCSALFRIATAPR
ncbi:MAG: transposase [Acidobacteriaceae bacterium]|nr:transposase [Acidobacteriaceae bacterium]